MTGTVLYLRFLSGSSEFQRLNFCSKNPPYAKWQNITHYQAAARCTKAFAPTKYRPELQDAAAGPKFE
jgi:hypothetical protein